MTTIPTLIGEIRGIGVRDCSAGADRKRDGGGEPVRGISPATRLQGNCRPRLDAGYHRRFQTTIVPLATVSGAAERRGWQSAPRGGSSRLVDFVGPSVGDWFAIEVFYQGHEALLDQNCALIQALALGNGRGSLPPMLRPANVRRTEYSFGNAPLPSSVDQ